MRFKFVNLLFSRDFFVCFGRHIPYNSMKAGRMAIHACQIGSTDTAPLTRARHTGLALGQGVTLWGKQLSVPIFPLLTRWCGWWNYIPPFGFIAVVWLAATWSWCRCWPAWITFIFRCWVANSKHWVLDGSGYWTPLRPLPR